MHIELVENSARMIGGVEVYRIRALVDIPSHHVAAGDLGGWVSSLYTTKGKPRIGKKAWVAHDACVIDQARVTGTAFVGGNAEVRDRARVKGNARVVGAAIVGDRAVIQEHATIGDNATIIGRAVVSGLAAVTGNATISGKALIEGSSFITDRVYVGGKAVITGAAYVYDSVEVRGKAVVMGVKLYGQLQLGEQAEVFGTAHLPPYGYIGGHASIGDRSDFIVLHPFGPQQVTVTVIRQRDNKAEVTYDSDQFSYSWRGKTKDCAAEIKRRWKNAQQWEHATPNERKLWRNQLTLLQSMVTAAMKTWGGSTTRRESRKLLGDSLSYELTSQTLPSGFDTGTRFRIKATRDIPSQGVRKGDLGGWVESAFTSTGAPRIQDDAWLHDQAQLWNDARIFDNATVAGHAVLSGRTKASGKSRIDGSTSIDGAILISGSAHVTEEAGIAGYGLVGGQALVAGQAEVHGEVFIHDDAQVTDKAQLAGYIDLGTGARITQNGDFKTFHLTPHTQLVVYRNAKDTVTILEIEDGMQQWEGSLPELEARFESRACDDIQSWAEYQQVISIIKLMEERWSTSK